MPCKISTAMLFVYGPWPGQPSSTCSATSQSSGQRNQGTRSRHWVRCKCTSSRVSFQLL